MSQQRWLTVRVNALHFPQVCCACGTSTLEHIAVTEGEDLNARTMLTMPLGFVIYQQLTLNVPWCRRCRRSSLMRRWERGLIGFVIGCGLTATAAVITSTVVGLPESAMVVSLIGGLGIVFTATVVGVETAPHLPLKFKRFRPRAGTVDIGFREGKVTQLTVQCLETA